MSKKENSYILKLLISVGLPIAIQNLLSNGVNLLDNFMVGTISEDALSAVSLANRSYFIFVMLLFGLISGIGIYSAQYFGSKDFESIRKMVGIALSCAIFFSTLMTIIISIYPAQTVRLFIKDEEVVHMGTEYIKIAVFSFIPTALSIVFQTNLRSIRLTKIPMMTSFIAVGLNALLNYALIFGKFGLPEMGVRGAALATVIARFAELIILLIFIYSHNDNPLKGNLRSYFSFDFASFKMVLTRSIPVVLHEGLWAIGTSLYFVAYAFLNSASVAAAQISLNTFDIFISLFIGLGNGAGVLVGNLLGEKKVDKVISYSNKIIFYQLILSIPLALMFLLVGSQITRFLNFSQVGIKATINTIYVLTAFLPIKCLNFLFIVGILRGGGDTSFNMIAETLSVWLVGVPIAFISVLVFNLPVYVCIALVNLEEVVKLVICSARYKSQKWINILVD